MVHELSKQDQLLEQLAKLDLYDGFAKAQISVVVALGDKAHPDAIKLTHNLIGYMNGFFNKRLSPEGEEYLRQQKNESPALQNSFISYARSILDYNLRDLGVSVDKLYELLVKQEGNMSPTLEKVRRLLYLKNECE